MMIRALALAPLARHAGPGARVASLTVPVVAPAPAPAAVWDAHVTAATLVARAQAPAAPSKLCNRARAWLELCTMRIGTVLMTNRRVFQAGS
jgi:hypothetical protein